MRLEGFKQIKGFDNYYINKEGKVINKLRNKEVKGRDNGRGYVDFILYKEGKRIHKFRHVLLMETFKPTDKPGMTVDHINGVPGDDRLDNLEYVEIKENIRRYHKNKYSIESRLKPVIVKFYKTGEVKRFSSQLEASAYLKIDRYEFLRRINGCKFGYMAKDYTMTKYESDPRDFPYIPNIDEYRDLCSSSKKCIIYNHITKETKKFDKLSDAAEFLNVKITTLTSKIRYYANRVFRSGWEPKLEGDPRPWAILTDFELERIKSGLITSRPVLAIKGSEVLEFKTSRECAKYFGYTPGGFHSLLRDSKNPTRNGYLFKYKKAGSD